MIEPIVCPAVMTIECAAGDVIGPATADPVKSRLMITLFVAACGKIDHDQDLAAVLVEGGGPSVLPLRSVAISVMMLLLSTNGVAVAVAAWGHRTLSDPPAGLISVTPVGTTSSRV